jgi:bifunctional UDP-N-acetylglucosamine pyrophosphorylase/glucosamine-1-phosphate N-acetyltransferase
VRVLIVNGDVPLVRGEDLRAVALALEGADPSTAMALATCVVDDPSGYGRVLREDGRVVAIREQAALRTDEEGAVHEINAGVYAVDAEFLGKALARLAPNEASGELYLTDIVARAREDGHTIAAVTLDESVLAGVNDRDQLARAEATMHARIARRWRLAGATVREGARVDAAVVLESDVTVESGAALRGRTVVRQGATVDVGCVLTDVVVEAGAVVKPYSVALESRIGPRAQVGPFAHLRAGSDIGEEARVGNFVETKKTTMKRGSKANHLAYVGDSVIGERANVGAGTIFCNYDGFQKHQTTIEEGVFIGSDSQIVAPVTIGANAYVATGTTVTKDVPAEALAIGRTKQENKLGYAPRLKVRLKPPAEKK